MCVCVCVCVMDCVKMEGADVGGAMTCRGWYGAQTGGGEAINHRGALSSGSRCWGSVPPGPSEGSCMLIKGYEGP